MLSIFVNLQAIIYVFNYTCGKCHCMCRFTVDLNLIILCMIEYFRFYLVVFEFVSIAY